MARARVEEAIARRWPSASLESPRVWTADLLWAEVRRLSPDGPRLLPASALRAALVEAIAGARRAGELRVPADLIDTAGYRRTIAARIASWTRAGLDPDSAPAGDDPDASAVHRRYRTALDSAGFEDREGFARWASTAFHAMAPRWLGDRPTVIIHDPSACGYAFLEALPSFRDSAESILVTLPGDLNSPDLSRRAVFADLEPLRQRLRDWGLIESYPAPPRKIQGYTPPIPPLRPAGLVAIGRELFRTARTEEPPDSPDEPQGIEAEGVTALGAPRGEGVALVVARTVRERLDAGADPDELLVVFPRWDEQAEAVRQTLRAWGIAAAGGPGPALAGSPAVATLRAALALPFEGWESIGLGLLLRNGRFRPDWPELADRHALADAALAIRDARVFRGLDSIRKALRRESNPAPAANSEATDPRRRRKTERARKALAIVDRLAEWVEPLARPDPWRVQVDKARRLAESIRVELPGDPGPTALGRLFAAAEEAADFLDAAGAGRRAWSWPAFVRELTAMAREHPTEPEPVPAGSIRLATLGETEGASYRFVVLAGLEAGTLPDRDAVAALLDPTQPEPAGLFDPEPPGPPVPLAREIRRMLAAVGLAESELIFVYPTTDEKGRTLDRSGFLDDVKGVFTDATWSARTREIHRLDPIPPPELAGSPAERRTRAVALACRDGADRELIDLAGRREHRGPLEGAALALKLTAERSRGKEVGPFDGLLGGPAVVRQIAADFESGRAAFSASQLETLALCPYKYFLKHLIRLEPSDDRGELDEDFIARGHLIHLALERLHNAIRAGDPDHPAATPDRVRAGIEPTIAEVLDGRPEPASDVEAGLRAIEAERLRRTGRRYARQFAAYHEALPGVACHGCEVQFGNPKAAAGPLQIGGPESGISLQGMIDRIDIYEDSGHHYFRIIDYKTGTPPAAGDVKSGIALQLPLYALAVERAIFAATDSDINTHGFDAGAVSEPLDMAYWNLKDESGFRPALAPRKLKGKGMLAPGLDWPEFAGRLEEFVLDLVDRLRHADLPVKSRKDDCTRSCEYRTVCRIGQVRLADKNWPAQPVLEPAS